MQKIYFKRLIDLNHQLKELISVSVDESIRYKVEDEGMRAVGSILINGEYKNTTDKLKFNDEIEIDIFALNSKIEDKNDFIVKVEDFDYSINEGNLYLMIQACIYGVQDDEERVIDTSEEVKEDTILQMQEPIVESKEKKVVEKTIKHQTKEKPEQEIEEDDEDLGVYYLYVVQIGDSYQSIAQKYQVDEYQLKEYNHDRPLTKGSIVIIPYYS